MTISASSDSSTTASSPLGSIPEPFKLSVRRGPFTLHNGPWYHWAEGDDFRQGVRLASHHCNGRGIAHGGFLSTFADGLMATAIFRHCAAASVTIQLTTEFLRPARASDWLQGTGWVDCQTRSLIFTQACAWLGDGREIPSAKTASNLVFTAHAIFKTTR